MKFSLLKRRRKYDSTNRRTIASDTEPDEDAAFLLSLCSGNKDLFQALSRNLIYEPKRQLPLLGSSQLYYQRGIRQKELGNLRQARSDFEWAARIEMCQFNMADAGKFLMLADSVSNDTTLIEQNGTLLSNLSKVEDIARKYYEHRNQVVTKKITAELPLVAMQSK